MPLKLPTVLPITIITNMDEDKNTTPQPVDQPEMIEKETYLRLAADFENYRRRMMGELEDMAKFGSAKVVQSMLDVLDHLETAMTKAPDAVRAHTEWFAGLEQVQQQFTRTMEQWGVQRIHAIGKPFDPSTMEAVSMIPGEQSQAVASEVRAGYTMHGRVIRPTRVVVYE